MRTLGNGIIPSIILIAGIFGGAFYFGSRARDHKRTAGSSDVRVAAQAGTTPVPAKSTPVGGVVVRVSAADAEVRIGDAQARKAPVVLQEQAVGTYAVHITHPDYDDWDGEIAVVEGKVTEIAPTLVRSTGDVLITDPSDAEVYDQSRKLGVVPLRLPGVPTGRVEYKLQAKGFSQITISGRVTKGSELRLSGKLEKSTGPEPGQPWLVPDAYIPLVWIGPGQNRFAVNEYNQKTHKYDEKVYGREIQRGFWLGKAEVSQNQWSAIMKVNPSRFKGGSLPVEEVTYARVVEFCAKLNEREKAAGRVPQGYKYTIPTPEQWDYACKAGSPKRVSKGFDALAWHDGNSGGRTHISMQKLPNKWGLYDMYGNVYEWCLGTEIFGQIAGGGWRTPSERLAAYDSPPGYEMRDDLRSSELGFRLILCFDDNPMHHAR